MSRPLRLIGLSGLVPALLLVLAAPLSAQAPAAETIEVSPAVVDLGDLYAGETGRALVTFTNRGSTPWKVKQVKTSCGCTVATVHAPDGSLVSANPINNLPVTVVESGESMKVEVAFEAGNAHGQVEKKLMIAGHDSASPSVDVPVRARITRVLAVTPPYLQLGKMPKRGVLSKEVIVDANDIGDWNIIGFESAIEGVPLPESLHFEVLDAEGDSRRVRVTVDEPRPVGQLTAQVRVLIDHERANEVPFTVFGVVEPDVLFSSGHQTFPEALVFDQLAPDTKLTRTLTVTNADPAVPYVLREAEVRGPKPEFFDAVIVPIVDGVSYEIRLTADAKVDMPFFRGSLVLHADHPELPEKAIQFHGWVKKAN